MLPRWRTAVPGRAGTSSASRHGDVAPNVCQPRHVHDELMAAVTSAVGDTDDVLAEWAVGHTASEIPTPGFFSMVS